MTPENRIPELDLLRGACILAMIAVHLIFDLTELYRFFRSLPPAFFILKNWGGSIFFLLSGVSATLGHHPLKRGSVVLCCAMSVSVVTEMSGMPVRFGALHALGSCMILWVLFRKFSQKALLYFALAILALGTVFEVFTVPWPFLYPLGLVASGFQSADYFPLFPYLGYFLAGSCLGKRLYPVHRSLFPQFSFSGKLSRALLFCGRQALLLYLLHQPVLIGMIEVTLFLRRKFL